MPKYLRRARRQSKKRSTRMYHHPGTANHEQLNQEQLNMAKRYHARDVCTPTGFNEQAQRLTVSFTGKTISKHSGFACTARVSSMPASCRILPFAQESRRLPDYCQQLKQAEACARRAHAMKDYPRLTARIRYPVFSGTQCAPVFRLQHLHLKDAAPESPYTVLRSHRHFHAD